jgi:hypothetical protein
MKLEFPGQIFDKYSNIKFRENSCTGNRVVPNGQTDTQAWRKLFRFSQFWERAQKQEFLYLRQTAFLVILVTCHIFIRSYTNIHILFIHTLSQNHYIVRKSTSPAVSEAESRHRESVSYGENSELISTLKGVMSLWLIVSSLSRVGDPFRQLSGTMLADVVCCSARNQVVGNCVHVSVTGWPVLRKAHRPFQTEFSTQRHLVLPPLNSSSSLRYIPHFLVPFILTCIWYV